jgi:glycosyltransferase involved in cell wall biosynthesis
MNDKLLIKPEVNDKNWIEISDPTRLPEKPLVSVLMLTYNHGLYLAEAIEGVLMQQTDFPIELLIGEDCSPDNTRAIAEHYQCEYPQLIRIITANRNVGVAENFDRLLATSKGEFIAFCEGDDYWVLPEKLALQVQVLQKRADVTAVFSDFVIARLKKGQWLVDYNKNAHLSLESHELRGSLFSTTILDGRLRTLTAIYRRTVFQHLIEKQIPYHLYPFLDTFFLAQAGLDGIIERIEDVTAVYRMSPNSATRTTSAKILQFLMAVREFYDNFRDYFPENAEYPQFDLVAMDINICRAAFIAGTKDTFTSTYEQIRNHGQIPLSLRVAAVLNKSDVIRRFSIAARAKSLYAYKILN